MFIFGIVFIYALIGILLLSAKYMGSDKRDSIGYVIAKIVYSTIYMGVTFGLVLFYSLYALYFNTGNKSPIWDAVALMVVWISVDLVYVFFQSKDNRGLIDCEKHISKTFAIISAIAVCQLWGKELAQLAYLDLSYILCGVLVGELYSFFSSFTRDSIQEFLKNVKDSFFYVKPYVWITNIVSTGVVLFLATKNSVAINVREYWSPFVDGIKIGAYSAIAIVVIITFLNWIGNKSKMLKNIRMWIKKTELWTCVLKIFISSIFVSLFVVRIKYPELNIDAISIILILLAMFPWYSQNIKALELNGIGKVELVSDREKEALEEKIAKVEVPQTALKEKPEERYSFYNLRYTDQKLALAGLRIEIEKELQQIAEKHQIKSEYKGIAELTKILVRNELITHNEYALIRDIIVVLNKAVHSRLDDYNEADFEWVFEIGLNVLESMKQRKG